MPTPYDLYVRFLVTKGETDLGVVNAKLDELNLPPIEEIHFEVQQDIVGEAIPDGIGAQIVKKTYSADFMKWMTILQVAELWQGEPFVKDREARSVCKLVYDVHQDIVMRMTINALLVKAVPAREVIQAVNAKYASLLREHHITLYEKFFFNPRQMTRAGWKAYLRRCVQREAAIYFTALSEPLDVVKTELELPAQLSSSESLQYLATKTFLKAKSALEVNTPGGADEARKWVGLFLNVTDKYEKYRTGDTADFGNSLQMEFDFIDDEFLTPDQEVQKELAEKKSKADGKGGEVPTDSTVLPALTALPEGGL
jgi:hypothetical protein